MRIETPTMELLLEAASMPVTSGIGLTIAQIEDEVAAGRLRPQWSQIAFDDSGDIIGRAMWWGRDSQTPIALDVWDAVANHPDASGILRALLERGHTVLATRGIPVPLPHTIRVPVAWRTDSAVARDARTKMAVAAEFGLGHHNERLQFEWHRGSSELVSSSRLRFESADDDAFITLFARAMRGSLDVMTRRELAASDALSFARDEVNYYRSCPGDREWWRVAYDGSGSAVGIAIPSATPTNRNVGYVAVLPEHRGHGYVDDLLGFITNFHADSGARRITATTDGVNIPMANAFVRAGYQCVETRIDLEC